MIANASAVLYRHDRLFVFVASRRCGGLGLFPELAPRMFIISDQPTGSSASPWFSAIVYCH